MWLRRRQRAEQEWADALGGRRASIFDFAAEERDPPPRHARPPRHSASRRRHPSTRSRLDGAPSTGSPSGTSPSTNLPAVRAERALLAIAVHAQQLDHRLARVEARLDGADAATTRAVEEHAMESATHEELLAVRLHSARLAAELARVSVELHGRVDDVASEQRRQRRTDVFAETVLELSDRLYDEDVIDLRNPPSDHRAASS
jgi:hypothetical protein